VLNAGLAPKNIVSRVLAHSQECHHGAAGIGAPQPYRLATELVSILLSQRNLEVGIAKIERDRMRRP
jgi:hypothetical protein